MTARRTGRHAPAFILLFLAESPAYGGELFTRMQKEMPHCNFDSPGFYRTLQALEDGGEAVSRFADLGDGPPRRVYSITATGLAALEEMTKDIRRSRENLDFFLNRRAGGQVR